MQFMNEGLYLNYKIRRMVFLQYKKSQKNNFTLQLPGSTLVSEAIKKIVEINNLRIYLDRLIWALEQLAKKGVFRPPELQGVSYQQYQKHIGEFIDLSQQKRQYALKPNVQPPFKFMPDKHFQRHGVLLPEKQRNLLLDASKQAMQTIQSKKQSFLIEQIIQTIEIIRNAVMEVYPAYIGLPQWQPVVLLLQEKLELQVLQSQNFELHDQKSTMWWAGKELDKNKTLSEYSGKNQKTKLIIKLQKFGGQQPAREPPIDAETYNKMVKYYYKKVQQSKEFQKKSAQTHYDKVSSQSMKEKLYLDGQFKFKPF